MGPESLSWRTSGPLMKSSLTLKIFVIVGPRLTSCAHRSFYHCIAAVQRPLSGFDRLAVDVVAAVAVDIVADDVSVDVSASAAAVGTCCSLVEQSVDEAVVVLAANEHRCASIHRDLLLVPLDFETCVVSFPSPRCPGFSSSLSSIIRRRT